MPKGHKVYWLGKKHSEKTKKKIGLANKGNRHTAEAKRKIGASLLGQSEEKNRSWKGDKAGYQAKHIRIRKKFGGAYQCENRENNVLDFQCNYKSKRFN